MRLADTISLVFGALFALLPAPAKAQAEIEFGGYFGAYSLSHDSSGITSSLGSPTSILEYSTLVGPRIGLSWSTPPTSQTLFTISASHAEIIGGTLRDTDYAVGQVVISDTFSAIRGNQTGASADFAPDFFPAWNTEFGTFRIHGTASVSRSQINALGLRCGIRCSSSPLPEHVAVIKQSHLALDVGAGVTWTANITDRASLNVKGSVALGMTNVDDSHTLRADLGPTPNVIYRFRTVRPSLSAKLTYDFSDTFSLNFQSAIDYTYGTGTLNLGPHSSKPIGPLPAQFQSFSSSLGMGLTAKF